MIRVQVMAALLTMAAVVPAQAQEIGASPVSGKQAKSSPSTTSQSAKPQVLDQAQAGAPKKQDADGAPLVTRRPDLYEPNSALPPNDSNENTWGRR